MIANGAMVCEPPEGESKEGRHSFVVTPVYDDNNRVIAVLGAMEFGDVGYNEIIRKCCASEIETTMFADDGRVFAHSSYPGGTPDRITHENRYTAAAAIALTATQESSAVPHHGVILRPYCNQSGRWVFGAWRWDSRANYGILVERAAVPRLALLATCGVALVTLATATRSVCRKRGKVRLDANDLGDRYHIRHQIGEGRFSRVFEAVDSVLERKIAVKILKTECRNSTSVAKFAFDAHLASQFGHPSIVHMYDFGVSCGGHPYLAMEYVPGKTLGLIVEEEKGLSPARSVQLSMKICEGLIRAHRQQLSHGDISPNNVMVCEDDGVEFVKILDFGLSSLLSHHGSVRPLQRIGTPHFTPPEVLIGHHGNSPAGDVYSLGAVMFFMVTGTLPFDGHSPSGGDSCSCSRDA